MSAENGVVAVESDGRQRRRVQTRKVHRTRRRTVVYLANCARVLKRKAKRAKKGVPLLAANLAQTALGADDNALTLYDKRGRHPLGRGPKLDQARKLVAHLAGMLKKR